MELCFLLDPLESLNGSLKPPFLIATKIRAYFNTLLISQFIDDKVVDALKTNNFDWFSSGKKFHFSGSLLNMEAWLRKSNINFEQAGRVVVNFSQCFLANADVYYAQGPMADALSDMYPEMRLSHRFVYSMLRGAMANFDKTFLVNLRMHSQFFVANSKFCASLYEKHGVEVDDIIYPPIDSDEFKPTTSRCSENYALTYFGKETKYPIIKTIADHGVKIKAFGSKQPYTPGYIRRHPNIEFEGEVSNQRLVELYSNAVFTLFTFTHEPFGYVPVESMACQTPVLTYNMQGPSETVVDGKTGWLAENDRDLLKRALDIWQNGYPKQMRQTCRHRALEFDVKPIASKWLTLLNACQEKARLTQTNCRYSCLLNKERLNLPLKPIVA